MDTPALKISVIMGSVRANRFNDKPAGWIADEARNLPGVEVEVIDLKDWPFPFYSEPTSPSMAKDGKYPSELATKWAAKIAASDGFIFVTPEYNHGYSAVLKNALDHVYAEWNKKVVGFVAYGSVGGARAVEQLRQVAIELQMASVRTSVHIPWQVMGPIVMGKAEWNAATLDDSLKGSAKTMLDQLVWWSRALKNARS